MQFELRSATFGRTVDSTVMYFKKVRDIFEPEIMIETLDNEKRGEFYFVIRTRFNINIPYYVDSNVFAIRILHKCVRNVIYGNPLLDQTYNVG